LLPLKDNIPTRRFPVITVVIILINVAIYFGWQHGGWATVDGDQLVKYAVIPLEVTHPDQHCIGTNDNTAVLCGEDVGSDQPSTWITLFTSMFMHGSLLHIGGNMLFLWIFGNNVEDSMGRVRFVAFYLLGGLVADFAQIATNPDAAIPTVGASGAVAAILGAYALLYPHARVVTLIFIIFFVTVIELPALLVLGGWFLLQLLSASSEPLAGGGVAYFAHIGGFLFGLAAIKLFADRERDDYVEPRLPVY
jgi:rhomboid family protein